MASKANGTNKWLTSVNGIQSEWPGLTNDYLRLMASEVDDRDC